MLGFLHNLVFIFISHDFVYGASSCYYLVILSSQSLVLCLGEGGTLGVSLFSVDFNCLNIYTVFLELTCASNS